MDDEALVNIKNLGREGRLEEAASVCETLGDDPLVQSVAYYSLGILFHMDSPKRDINRAEVYYLEAQKGGPYASWAKYRLGTLYLERNAFRLALDQFRRVANDDASAAYWVYRILDDHVALANSAGEAREYLDLAIRLGHIPARRVDIVERLKCKQGFLPFVKAIADYFKLFPQAYRAVADDKEFLYQ